MACIPRFSERESEGMIHYHGTPLSGDIAVQVRGLKARHAMVSFWKPSQIEIVAEVCQSFCIDNGAFSAWKNGGTIDLEAYAEFIDKCHGIRLLTFTLYLT